MALQYPSTALSKDLVSFYTGIDKVYMIMYYVFSIFIPLITEKLYEKSYADLYLKSLFLIAPFSFYSTHKGGLADGSSHLCGSACEGDGYLAEARCSRPESCPCCYSFSA